MAVDLLATAHESLGPCCRPPPLPASPRSQASGREPGRAGAHRGPQGPLNPADSQAAARRCWSLPSRRCAPSGRSRTTPPRPPAPSPPFSKQTPTRARALHVGQAYRVHSAVQAGSGGIAGDGAGGRAAGAGRGGWAGWASEQGGGTPAGQATRQGEEGMRACPEGKRWVGVRSAAMLCSCCPRVRCMATAVAPGLESRAVLCSAAAVQEDAHRRSARLGLPTLQPCTGGTLLQLGGSLPYASQLTRSSRRGPWQPCCAGWGPCTSFWAGTSGGPADGGLRRQLTRGRVPMGAPRRRPRLSLRLRPSPQSPRCARGTCAALCAAASAGRRTPC